MANASQADIQPTRIEELSWKPEEALSSLTVIFKYVVDDVTNAITWFLKAKKPKQKRAVFLRLGAVFATAFAGIVPILQQIFLNGRVSLTLFPAWHSLFHQLAVILQAPAW